MHKSTTPAVSPRHKKRENNGGWKRFRTWVIGVAALLTPLVVMAVIFVVTGNMNPPQKNPAESRYAAVIYKTPYCGCCGEYIGKSI
jgi:hypothetical protein